MLLRVYIIFSVLISVLSCTKENGKHLYEFELVFSSGDKIKTDVYLFEKAKEYEESYTKTFYKENEVITLRPKYHSGAGLGLSTDFLCFKTTNKNLIGLDKAELNVNNFASLSGISGRLLGLLSMHATYKSPFRKIKVEQGTFTFQWSNAADFGLNDTTLTGTWTLKRK